MGTKRRTWLVFFWLCLDADDIPVSKYNCDDAWEAFQNHPSFSCRLGMCWDTSRQILKLSTDRKSYQEISWASKTKISVLFIKNGMSCHSNLTEISWLFSKTFYFLNSLISFSQSKPWHKSNVHAVVSVVWLSHCYTPVHSCKCFQISKIPDLALEEDIHYLLLHLDFILRKKF